MAGETKNGMQCAEFDALLNEALDGTLAGSKAGKASMPMPGSARSADLCSRRPMRDGAG